MPQSKKRKHHQSHHTPSHQQEPQKNSRAVLASVIFFALAGLGISFFAAGSDIVWLIVGTIAGVIGGYFFGHQVDKALTKK